MTECDVCGSVPFKYRCPECSRRSCSLSCVKVHKVDFKCSGVRNKTAFVPLSQFSDNLLYSDYYFLEDVGRCLDAAQRCRVQKRHELGEGRSSLQRFYWLKQQALRRQINLFLLPEGMSRHQANTSRSVKRTGQFKKVKQWEIEWRVQLQFPSSEMEFQEDNVSENQVLSELVDRYIHPSSSDPIARHQLKVYVNSRSEVEVLLENNEHTATKSYHRLNQRLTLLENFVGKTIIEYPTLRVVLRENLPNYSLEEDAATAMNETQKATPTAHTTDSAAIVPTSTTATTAATSVEERPVKCDELQKENKMSALTLIAQGYNSDSCASDEDYCV